MSLINLEDYMYLLYKMLYTCIHDTCTLLWENLGGVRETVCHIEGMQYQLIL